MLSMKHETSPAGPPGRKLRASPMRIALAALAVSLISAAVVVIVSVWQSALSWP
jgi:hypothetical protein